MRVDLRVKHDVEARKAAMVTHNFFRKLTTA